MSRLLAFVSTFAVIHIGIDPVALPFGSGIHWYGICYAVAFWIAYRFGAWPHAQRHGVSKAQADRVLIWTIIMGLLGARLYYDVQSDLWDKVAHPIELITVWQGGMAFFGAILARLVTIPAMARRERLPIWPLLDAGALFAVVGQPIGRIGNVINGDILGSPSTLPWATAYTNPHAVLQKGFDLCTPARCVAYQIAAVYEAIGTILIGALLFWMRRRGARPGALVVSYVALYAISQIVMIAWRVSEPVVLLGLKQAQVTGLVVLCVVTPLLWLVWRRTSTNDRTGEPAATRASRRGISSTSASAVARCSGAHVLGVGELANHEVDGKADQEHAEAALHSLGRQALSQA